MQKRLHKHIAAIMSASMLLYLAKITALSPIYVIYLSLMPLMLVHLFVSTKYRIPYDCILLAILLALTTILNFENLATGEYINLSIGIIAYIYIRSLRKTFEISDWLRLINIMSFATILILGADSVYRLTHPTTPSEEAGLAIAQDESLWFYPYKFGTLMFADSNTTGLAAMIVLFLIIAARSSVKLPIFRWDTWVLLAIIALSISRSAIAATLIGLFYYAIKNTNQKYRFATGLLFLIPITIAAPFVFSSIFEYDGSFLSKFYIAQIAIDYISNATINSILLGTGLGKSIDLFGIHTHLIYLTYLIECGAIALAVFIIFFWVYIKFNGLLIPLPILLASASYFLYLGSPFLFVPMAIWANISASKKYCAV